MTVLLEIRERIRRFYSNNGRFIRAGAKFLLMLMIQLALRAILGYDGILASIPVIIGISMLLCILPNSVSLGATVLLCAAGCYLTAGPETALVFGLMYLVFSAMYFVFKPEKSYVVTLSILLSLAQFFGILPMLAGLMFSPLCLISVCIGIITGAFITYVSGNLMLFSQASELSAPKKIITVTQGVFLDSELWIDLFLVVGVAIIVYFIRRRSVKHNWPIAIATGCVCTLLLNVIFSMVSGTGENYVILAVNVFLEAFTGVVLMFFFFMVDYSSEQVLQFEDDEFYYYVKAVPKLTLATQEVKVTRIRERNIKSIARTADTVRFLKDEGEDAFADSEPESGAEE